MVLVNGEHLRSGAAPRPSASIGGRSAVTPRHELPLVLGGAPSGVAPRTPPAPTRRASEAPSRAAESSRWRRWGTSVAWAASLGVCALSAFAVRGTLFPDLGRTDAPSAWQAPVRQAEDEAPEPTTGTTIDLFLNSGGAFGGTVVDAHEDTVDSTSPASDGSQPSDGRTEGPAIGPVQGLDDPTATSTPGHTTPPTTVAAGTGVTTPPPTTADPAGPITTTTDAVSGKGKGSGGGTDDTIP